MKSIQKGRIPPPQELPPNNKIQAKQIPTKLRLTSTSNYNKRKVSCLFLNNFLNNNQSFGLSFNKTTIAKLMKIARATFRLLYLTLSCKIRIRCSLFSSSSTNMCYNNKFKTHRLKISNCSTNNY